MKKTNKLIPYCKSQDEWIKENVSGKLDASISRCFFKVFGVKRSLQALRVRANVLGVRPKLRELIVFKSVKRDSEGRERILVSKNPVRWKSRARWEYEKMHNVELSSNDVIISIDGDRTNYARDNLIKITRSENLRFNNMRGKYVGAEIDTLVLLAKIDNISANLSGKGDWSSDEIEWLVSNVLGCGDFDRVTAFNSKFNKNRSAREISMMAAVIRRRNGQ